MKQLVQLQKQAKKFEELNTEVVLVFREEKEGIAGLKKIKKRTKTTFTLAVDLNKKSSHQYSSVNRTFDNYVIDKSGVIRAVIDGTLMKRANSDQLMAVLADLQ